MRYNKPSKQYYMVIGIKGAGDIASGIACRLYRSGFEIIMTETAVPTTVRRTAAFSPAVYNGDAQVENIAATLCKDTKDIDNAFLQKKIAIIVDDTAEIFKTIKPHAIIDAILAKKNLGTKITDAPCVVGIGPGFCAGVDCHAVVETQRGHDLGRVLYTGCAAENTGIPGNIGGFTLERLLRASDDGVFEPICQIGDSVTACQAVAKCSDKIIYSQIDGVIRGLLQKGVVVTKGMKCGDVDPRCKSQHCYTVSDKALAVGGGALEAVLHFGGLL